MSTAPEFQPLSTRYATTTKPFAGRLVTEVHRHVAQDRDLAEREKALRVNRIRYVAPSVVQAGVGSSIKAEIDSHAVDRVGIPVGELAIGDHL